jgi:hypothetical protein
MDAFLYVVKGFKFENQYFSSFDFENCGVKVLGRESTHNFLQLFTNNLGIGIERIELLCPVQIGFVCVVIILTRLLL